ncbi:nucleotidyltransferase domain-containing protein, partial [bacterium]|nr:nucleotidyltransferase domain-containing protein [bacterium]
EEYTLIWANKVGRAILYKLNNEHWFLSEGLIPLWNKIDSWLKALGDFYLNKLSVAPLSIILFGSFAKGEAKKESDLDLLFVYEDHKFHDDIIGEILEMNSIIFAKFGVSPSPKIISLSKFKKEIRKGEGFMRNIFLKGKSITGLTPSEVIFYDSKKSKNI